METRDIEERYLRRQEATQVMEYVFLSSPSSYKSRRLIDNLCSAARSAGLKCKISQTYIPCNVLVLYGLGGADRYPVALKHMKDGGTVVSFDIGYWERELPRRKYRVSVNGFHPKTVMQGEHPGSSRWDESGLTITDGFNPDGPIMLVGNAPKSIAVGAKQWTAKTSTEIRKVFPERRILYRPKPHRPMEQGITFDEISTGTIDTELQRCSLVVCRHSNVAVDACRLGVPVICDDGAAASIYPNRLNDHNNQPDIEIRTEFLERLAYWQWRTDEAELFWSWFLRTFPALDPR